MENAKSYLLNFVVSLVQRFCNKSNAAVSYCFRKNSYTHLVCIDCEDSLKDEFYAERMKFVIEFAEKFGEDIIRRAKFAQDPGEHMAGGLDKARRTGVTKPVPKE